jgi:D-3-phosphoglycerate dehydrogenase
MDSTPSWQPANKRIKGYILMTSHILIPDGVHPAATELLEAAGGLTVEAPGKLNREQTLAALPNADALIIRSSTKADAELIAAAPKLRVIVRAGVGVDNVDLPAATSRGIVVMNAPQGNTISTAEHTLALILALARNIPQAHQSMVEGRWDRKAFVGTELNGKRLGIVGLGRVGQAVAERARALGMAVFATEPCAERAIEAGIDCVPLETLFAQSDIITLHTSLTEETRGLIDAHTIAMMKPGIWLINAARGALLDDEAVAEALRSGHIARAAFDVYASEPPAPDNPLLGLPNVIYTPHLGASTAEAQEAVAVLAAQEAIDALLHGEFRNVVNPAALEQIAQG